MDTELFAGQARTELGVGNRLHTGPAKLLENLRRVQERNDLDLADEVQGWVWPGASESCVAACRAKSSICRSVTRESCLLIDRKRRREHVIAEMQAQRGWSVEIDRGHSPRI